MKHDLHGQTFLVLGLGKSGLGAIALLLAQGARVLATADRASASPVDFLTPDQALQASFDNLILSPGAPLEHPLVQHALALHRPVLGELELAYRFLSGPIAAITGSNGKTTTTALAGRMLERSGIPVQVGGNIGLAVTAMVSTSRLLQLNLLEVSSFQLESIIHFRPNIAAVLNVTPNHLDRHGDLEAYRNAKGRIFKNQLPADHAVLNQADPGSSSYAPRLSSRVSWFEGDAAQLSGNNIELFGRALMGTGDIPLPGRHNLENAMAAAVVASLAGASHEAIAQAAADFRGVPHRLEFIRDWRGVKFYNDSKATSVDAALKAVSSLPGPLWLILGGKGKGAPYTPLLPQLLEKAHTVLVIGEDASNIERDLAAHVQLLAAGTLAHAIELAASSASPGDTVLLAPACASYDQFQSFEQRGDTFRDLVNAL